MRRVVRHLRQQRIITRRTFLALAAIVNAFCIGFILIHTISFPNTMVGTVNVGLKTKARIRSILARAYTSPITLNVHAQQYGLTYEHIGVYLDDEQTVRTIFSVNREPFPRPLAGFLKQLTTPRVIPPPLSFSQEFSEYVEKLNEAGSAGEDIVYIDQENKRATLFASKDRYAVNTQLFEEALRGHFGRNGTPLIVPMTQTPSTLEENIARANTKLSTVYRTPLIVIVGINGENQFITLSPEDLRRYTTARISAATGTVDVAINTGAFLPDLTTALSAYQASFNPSTALERIGNGVRNALMTRYEGGPAESVKVGIDSGPNTDGAITEQYIEVDISQQKLFTFKNGTLVKTYRVSTGKDYPTPTGTFRILNKTGLGFSSIYNVWLPYWMAFEYSKELRAYFGIHELPYYYTGSQKITRPREFIGAPNTGGCVALDVGDAKEVYQFADIGTVVVIYQ